MQKSNFEKQIREQLEELHFRPSAPVWENVAADIKAKRRRRVIAYLFSSLLLLSGALFITYYTTRSVTVDQLAQKNKSIETPRNEHTAPTIAGKGSPSRSEASASTAPTQNNPTDIELTPPRQGAPIAEGLPNLKTTPSKHPAEIKKSGHGKSQNPYGGEPRNYTGNTRFIQPKADPTKTDRQLANANPSSANNVEQGLLDNKPESENQATATASLNPASDIVSPVEQAGQDHPSNDEIADTPLHNVQNASEHSETASSQSKNNKWEWGIETGLGLGFRRDGVLPGISTDKAARVDLMQGSAVVGPAFGFAILRYFPSASNEGVGFSLGVNGRYPISRSLKFTAGLRYSYQSEQIRIGRSYDSMLVFNNYLAQRITTNNSYVGPQNNTFSNQYHFLQVPIGLELKLNKGRKTPISWEIGVAPGLLAGTQALVYDTAYNGIYYKDKAQFNLFQLTASSGLSIELRNKRGLRFVVGPEVRSNLTALAENGYDDRQYLFYGGLRARIFLPR